MNLKTLKDIECEVCADNGFSDIVCTSKDLKQEAIKWIKKCGCLTNWNSRDWQCCDGCKRFIDFFNIKESDLK